jgi:molecular chaperone GrpE
LTNFGPFDNRGERLPCYYNLLTDMEKETKKKKKTNPKDEEISQLKATVEELNDKYLRLYSEFDNYRRRTLKEKTELSKTASEDIMISLLPVLDDLERA